jgi:hypothetical protein
MRLMWVPFTLLVAVGARAEVVRKDLASGDWGDRCRVTGTTRGGALQIRVAPDCWWWDVEARRAGAGWKILDVSWGDHCD